MSTPTRPLTRELVRMACLAPSLHNTQPWRWRIAQDARTVELYADRERQLASTDPHGRELAIACGAALHHFTVAAKAFGLVATVEELPDRGEPDLLARIRLTAGETTDAALEALTALEDRTTDRRAFTDWEVPTPRLVHLAEAARRPGVQVVVLTDPGNVARTEHLMEQARLAQRTDRDVAREQDEWTRRLASDGVPPDLAAPSGQPGTAAQPSRFSGRRAATVDDAPGALVVICTTKDDQPSWLRAGEALSALWLGATQAGLALTPQTEVIEVASTRRLLRRDVFDGLARPQLVARIGWRETTSPPLQRTPRRELDSVLLP